MNDFFIRTMIKESMLSFSKNEIPVGAVIQKGNQIISKSHNLKESTNIATSHAEINSINKACLKLNSWRLENCSMYVSLEPCIMCAGAIFESRIKNLYIGIHNPYNGFFSCNNYYYKNLNIIWLNDKRCQFLIDKFFQKIRKE